MADTTSPSYPAALEQIEVKKYETELIERGIEKIKKLAVVFNGKEVHGRKKPIGCKKCGWEFERKVRIYYNSTMKNAISYNLQRSKDVWNSR